MCNKGGGYQWPWERVYKGGRGTRSHGKGGGAGRGVKGVDTRGLEGRDVQNENTK